MSLERFVKKIDYQKEEKRNRPAVLVVTSQVVRGGIGGRSSVFALERFGFPTWFLPTVMLPWHPGQGAGTRICAEPQSFAHIVDELSNSRWLSEIGGIITGYMGNEQQAQEVAQLVRAVKQQNPDAQYMCDPVIGDAGGLYVPESVANSIKEHLLPLADFACPNRFELSWLTAMECESEVGAVAAARSLGVERSVITSAPAMRRNSIANLLVSSQGAMAVEHAEVIGAPHGTGDLLAAIFMARVLSGSSEEVALKKATASTFELVARTVKMGSTELLYAGNQEPILQPLALVNERRIAEAPARA
ncbi:pyridoxal kinase [Polycladidibacter stylochi]|uniref:pyridoxal kinase n=1 Tax=Polycladidibacter stylochi TaxID=1807766 RepID=UPI00082EDA78|nr:pyridoxal kinase [Pseudovibrio stylochi]